MTEAASRPIPCVTVEEHHEAFLVWHYAIREGWIPRHGNALLHVDEHSDLSLPRLRRSIDTLNGDLQDLAAFVYNELDIGNFIWPAVYQELFAEVYWMRYRHKTPLGRRRMLISAKDETSTEFVTGMQTSPFSNPSLAGWKGVEYATLTTDDEFRTDSPVILDIDLDYFCSNAFPDYAGKRLEITKAAYDEFLENRYHFLRIAPGSRITPVAENGQYYFRFNDFPPPPRGPDMTEESITGRMDAFLHFLQERNVRPILIDICRSRHSGYTPDELCLFIENLLRERLCLNYDLQTLAIHDLSMSL